MKVRIATAAVVGLTAIGAFYSLHAQSQPMRSVWDGVYTEEQANRGAALYGRECAGCHGDSLTGSDEAPALSGSDFLANWNGLTLGDLFERIRISMPADHPGKLNREQTADILAHILTVNRFPAGKTQLERQTEVLKQIRLEAAKPDLKK